MFFYSLLLPIIVVPEPATTPFQHQTSPELTMACLVASTLTVGRASAWLRACRAPFATTVVVRSTTTLRPAPAVPTQEQPMSVSTLARPTDASYPAAVTTQPPMRARSFAAPTPLFLGATPCALPLGCVLVPIDWDARVSGAKRPRKTYNPRQRYRSLPPTRGTYQLLGLRL